MSFSPDPSKTAGLWMFKVTSLETPSAVSSLMTVKTLTASSGSRRLSWRA